MGGAYGLADARRGRSLSAHLLVGGLISVRVHGGQEVDACVGDEPHHSLVSPLELATQVLHEVEHQLSAQDLVAVHPSDVAELWLACPPHDT